MDNVLQDMVQRLRAIELLLRTQNELLTRVLAELEQTRRCAEESNGDGVVPALSVPSRLIGRHTKRQVLQFHGRPVAPVSVVGVARRTARRQAVAI